MSASLLIPLAITGKTTQEVSKKLLAVQSEQGGKVSIITIYFDPENKLHTLWYLPIKSLGGGLF